MQAPLSVGCYKTPTFFATTGKSANLCSQGSDAHTLLAFVEGMNRREANKESVDEDTQAEKETSEEAASLPMPGTAVHQSMQVPMHLQQQQQQQQQLNPGMMNGATAMPMFSSMALPMHTYGFMQAPMYYPFQQHQMPMFNFMSPLSGGALGVLQSSSMLPYNSSFPLQQQLSQGIMFNSQAAALNQRMLQQNQGPTARQGLGRLSAISAQADQHAAAVTEPESSSSQKASSASTSATSNGGTRRTIPEDRPKRPLSAYNFFFKDERAKMIAEAPGEVPSDVVSDHSSSCGGRKRKKQKPHRKVGFEEMARVIGRKWKTLDPELRPRYQAMAEEEKKRYKANMDAYMGRQRDDIEKCREQLEATVSDETRQQYLASSGSRPVKRKRKDTESSDSA